MSATLLSSFLVFVAAGVFSLFWLDHSGGWVSRFSDGHLAWFIFFSLMCNAVYFYYYSALAELHTPARDALKNAPRLEWVIRVFNHTLMLLLWATFDTNSPWLFGACLFLLYTTFLLWDVVTYRALKANVQPVWLVAVDVLGFLIALGLGSYLLYWMSLVTPQKTAPVTLAAVFGALCAIYLVIAVGGLCFGFLVYKFNPFSKEFRNRTALH